MQRVTEQVDTAYLQQSPPRRLSPAVIANLLSDHIFERPLKPQDLMATMYRHLGIDYSGYLNDFTGQIGRAHV